MKYLYRTYQLLFALPLLLIWTVIISLMVIIGCSLGGGHFWGYYPGHYTPAAATRESRRQREHEEERVVCHCCQPSGRFRHLPHLRFPWQTVQVDDEIPATQNSVRGICMREVSSDIRRQARTEESEGDLRQGTRHAMWRYELGCVSRRGKKLHRTHGKIPPRCIYACRRATAAYPATNN